MELSEKLKKLRSKKGKTQQQACDEMKIAISSLRNYENGKIPDTVQLKILKEYYNVTYEYLLDYECNNESEETVNIGKELGLSDDSIDIIKSVKDNKKGLNYFIENFEFKEMISYMELYMKINDILENDMNILEMIEEMKEYIIKSKRNNKVDELKDYFEECTIIVKKILDLFYTKNEIFEASDSKFDLFEDAFDSMINDIFNEEYLDNSFEDIFIGDLEEYCDLMDEVKKKYYNIRQMIKFNIIEIVQRFYFDMEPVTNLEIIRDKRFSQFYDKYIDGKNKTN